MIDANASYAVFISPIAVEIHSDDRLAAARGRCICKQANYASIHRFARNLALRRHLPLCNYAES